MLEFSLSSHFLGRLKDLLTLSLTFEGQLDFFDSHSLDLEPLVSLKNIEITAMAGGISSSPKISLKHLPPSLEELSLDS